MPSLDIRWCYWQHAIGENIGISPRWLLDGCWACLSAACMCHIVIQPHCPAREPSPWQPYLQKRVSTALMATRRSPCSLSWVTMRCVCDHVLSTKTTCGGARGARCFDVRMRLEYCVMRERYVPWRCCPGPAAHSHPWHPAVRTRIPINRHFAHTRL